MSNLKEMTFLFFRSKTSLLIIIIRRDAKMKNKGVVFCVMSTVLTLMSNEVLAETVTESWLRQAGISCGGGLSVEAQGKIDAALLKRLRLGSVNANGSYQFSQTESLLKQFRSEEKRDTYGAYVECLVTLMKMAANASGLPPEKVILNSPIAVAPLETVQRNQRFVMKVGDVVAVKNYAITLTINKITNTSVYYTWSNSETNVSGTTNRSQSQLIKLGEQCTLVPYKIEGSGKSPQVSFLSNC